MQDSRLPRNRKPEEAEPSEGRTPASRRRQWQDVLNEQLRALYESYRADEIPAELLTLAARIEEAQRKSQTGTNEPPPNGTVEDKSKPHSDT